MDLVLFEESFRKSEYKMLNAIDGHKISDPQKMKF